jgi:hypothetical protein
MFNRHMIEHTGLFHERVTSDFLLPQPTIQMAQTTESNILVLLS